MFLLASSPSAQKESRLSTFQYTELSAPTMIYFPVTLALLPDYHSDILILISLTPLFPNPKPESATPLSFSSSPAVPTHQLWACPVASTSTHLTSSPYPPAMGMRPHRHTSPAVPTHLIAVYHAITRVDLAATLTNLSNPSHADVAASSWSNYNFLILRKPC